MNCSTGKIGYPSPAAAWRIIDRLGNNRARHTHAKSGKGWVAYRCTECDAWHITRGQRTVGRPPQEVA